MAIEIVDVPINSMVVFHSYVSLPEGITILYAYLSGMGIFFMWAPLFIAWYRTPKKPRWAGFPALWQGWSPVILIGAIPTLDTAPYRFWKNRNSWQKSMTQWLSCAEGFLSCFSLACYVLIRKHWDPTWICQDRGGSIESVALTLTFSLRP